MFKLRGRHLVLFISFVAIIPVWIPTYFPATDLPQHAAQIGMLRNLHSSNFPCTELLHVNWFTPYLFGYALVCLLTPLLGMLISFKLVISAALIGFVHSTEFLINSYEGDGRLALLVIPTLYGGVTMWGFFNFLVAAPLGLLFLCCFLRQMHKPTTANRVIAGLFFAILFFAHALIWAFLGALSLAVAVVEKKKLQDVLLSGICLAPAIPVALIWIRQVQSHPRISAGGIVFETLRERISLANTFTFGWQVYSAALLGMLLLLLPLMIGYRFRREVRIWVPFAFAVFTVLLLPFSAFGTAFLFPRFVIFVLPMYAITLAPVRGANRVSLNLALLTLIGLCWTVRECRQMNNFQRESICFSRILEQMEPNALVLAIPLVHSSDYAYGLAYMHFPAWYGGLKGGVVSPNFARTHVQLVVFNKEVPYEIALPWEWEWGPRPYITPRILSCYRYIVVESKTDSTFLFEDMQPHLVLRTHTGIWWLYENPSSTWGVPASRTQQ